MKPTRRNNILRSLRGSLNRFLSILFIVALGSGFMAGLAATSPDMYETADRYMDENQLFDLDIKSALGLTAEDVEAVRSLSGVKTAVGACVTDAVLAAADKDTYTCRIYATLPEEGENAVNRFVLKDGRLPKTPEECVIQITKGRYFNGNIALGDTLTLSRENGNYDTLSQMLASDTLTVVGFVESPMCISITAEPSTVGTGSVAIDVYTQTSFCVTDVFTDIFVLTEDGEALLTFSDEYKALIVDWKERLTSLGEERGALRHAEVMSQYAEKAEALRQAIAAMESAKTPRQNAAGITSLPGQEPALSGISQETPEAVTSAWQTGATEESLAVLEELKRLLSEIETAMANLESGNWILRTRLDMTGYSTYDSNVGKVAALSKIFPVFFFLVALLVALTTMTRLVEERRKDIGTLKALGFRNGQILGEYMLFSLSSSVLGCFLGFGVGFWLFPKAISSAYGMMFTLPATVTPIRLSIVAWVAPITIGSIILATLLACWNEFRACPASLMQPKAPAPGKRIFLERVPFLWNRLSFTHKVTCRNIFRYKKRFFMTVIGVAGCSALLVTGFGLRDSVNDIVDRQYGEIYHYDLNLMLKDAEAFQKDEELGSLLAGSPYVKDSLIYATASGKCEKNNSEESLTFFVPQNTDILADFVTLRQRGNKTSLSLEASGAVLTEKLCESLGIGVGDSVTLENSNGKKALVTVTGVAENYISSYAYLSPEAYRSAFGEEPVYDTVLCHLPEGMNSDTAITTLMARESVIYAGSTASLKDSFADSIKSINGVVLVLILSAGLLCMVVLYNLTNVNICERRKELATIRVLGFHPWEVERYIFRESDCLSLLGAAVGLLVGIWLHAFVVRTVEIDQVMFGRTIYPLSYVFALLISVVFTLIVDRIMRRTVSRIDMVEAMKAND